MPKPKLLLSAFAAVVIAALCYGQLSTSPRLTYTVQAGDSLWSIAAERYPDTNTARIVGQIQRMNELGPLLQVGQQIKLP